jgi:uncharacterized membrane protein
MWALVCFLTAAPAFAKTAPHECRNTRYSMVLLPFRAEVISPSGLVAGTNEAGRPVLWRRQSAARELPVPQGFRYAEPVAISASGQVIVDAFDSVHRKRGAFIYSGRSVTALAGEQTFAHGVSAAGVVVGESILQGQSRAVFWAKNVPHAMQLCCGGTIKAANRSGVMIGEAYDEEGRYHAVVWDAAVLQGSPRVLLPDAYSAAVAVNDAGHILVQAGREVYLEVDSRLRKLELSPGSTNTARSMNECDFVVGGYGPDSDRYRGFLWSPASGFQDLNTLVPPGSQWTVQDALGINDRGEIVGKATLGREDSGVLLIPVR